MELNWWTKIQEFYSKIHYTKKHSWVRFFKENWFTIMFLSSIFLLEITINLIGLRNIQIPLTRDELEYIGIGNQIIFFDTIPFNFGQGFRFFFSAISSTIQWLLPIDQMIVIRFLHLLFLGVFVIGSYRLGRIYSPLLGILIATFTALFSTPQFTLDLAAWIPSLVVYTLTPFLLYSLLKNEYKQIIIYILIIGIIHIWLLGPILIVIGLFAILKRNKKMGLILAVISLPIVFLLRPLTFSYFGSLKFLALEPQILPGLIQWLAPFMILGLLGLTGLIIERKKINQRLDWLYLAGSLIFILALFWASFDLSYGFTRSLFFPALGFILLGAMGWTILLKTKFRSFAVLACMLSIIFMFQRSIFNHFNGLFHTSPTTLTELQAYEWLKIHTTPQNIVLLSDYGTMEAAHFYLPIKNSITLDEIRFKQPEFSNQPVDENHTMSAYFAPYYDFFLSPTVTSEHLDWLKTLPKEYGTYQIYIMFTGRSRQNFYYYQTNHDRLGGMGISSEAVNYYTVPALSKFYISSPPFELVYHKEDIDIFWIKISSLD
ncbi:MAG: hypothetical protein UT55_C0040G0002 [Candidatus Peregrinibacteria bacterium GW2011_GWE2_39_6]|nr:MAG: hypothetical protein UT36_C0003G0066 [Candidatus Peregrinibacteria bacterium GW2011_GWF2_39_17]KKR25518.1 MAG: hypothetical protein UT55_C0040G0002 [Candidatus Peregrinibacteria bacterium GW2011_GWE2_39_6]HCW31972.1 hypothetical protein [Candidatus Peregrinibacteria bacterium]